MRIISSPGSAAPLCPIHAPDAVENRTHRDQSPAAAARPLNSARTDPGIFPVISVERNHFEADRAMVDAGVMAQKVFHAIYGDRPEASLTEANRAYTKTDSLRFRETPFSVRVL
jgi:hypothetical protein